MKIYVAMHKPYSAPEDPLYVPIQAGAANRAAFCDVRDDTGRNISGRNASFCELTVLYWLRHNTCEDVAGLVHYRRYFAGKQRTGSVRRSLLTEAELQTLMQDVQIVLPRKRHYVIETTLSQYAHAHHEKDLHLMRGIVEKNCPQELPAFDRVMKSRSGHRFNMLIMKREALEAYCDWLFPLLFELEKQIDISSYDAYNRRVFGFIGERLLDVWLQNCGYAFAELPVLELERPNWFIKGGRFLWRKITHTLRTKSD